MEEASLFDISPLYFTTSFIGKTISRSKICSNWQFKINSKSHEIKLYFSTITNKVYINIYLIKLEECHLME